MSNKRKIIFPLLFLFILVSILSLYLNTKNVAVLDPAGEIGTKERNLIYFGIILSAIVVVPVYILTIFIVIRYKDGNKKAKYSPEWDGSIILESIWWAIPMVIITILSVITWNSSHALDPYKALSSTVKPITIEVVALDWKWLFIYPDQHIASVNRVEFPSNTPVDFYVTSDTVMNSFWIPNLGGQIYAMPGMSTQLHLISDKTGSYYGSSANISGVGFSGMNFKADSVSSSSYNSWIKSLKQWPVQLNMDNYNKLAMSSKNNPVSYYSRVDNRLYDNVVSKYMTPMSQGAMY